MIRALLATFCGFALYVGLCIALAALPALLFGCASSTITVYRKGEATPSATVEQQFSGRGCIAVETAASGATSVVLAQDGTDDWSPSRLLGFLGDIAGSVFGGGDGAGEMQAPSTAAGCAQIFESAPEPL